MGILIGAGQIGQAIAIARMLLGLTRPTSMISYPIISVGLIALVFALYPLSLRELIAPATILSAGTSRIANCALVR